MADRPLQTLVRHIQRMAGDLPDSEQSDRVLLARFIAQRDQAAFTLLVQRHGPMVRGVCGRILGQSADVDDAFQATFLLLVRKAQSIRKAESVGSWLHGVAHRLACQIKASAARRRVLGHQPVRQTAKDPGLEAAWRELCVLLDDEVQCLSPRYRAPLVLCYLEGQTRDQAARQLGWSLRTLDRRLVRGRELLRLRLARRGLKLSAGLLVAAMTDHVAFAAVPGSLLNLTLDSATLVAQGNLVATAASSRVAVLVQEGLGAMFLTKLRMVTLGTIMLAGIAGGGFVLFALAAPGQDKNVAQHTQGEAGRPTAADDFPAGVNAHQEATRTAGQPVDPKQFARERAKSANNLKQMALAMANYESAFARFPAPAIYSGQPARPGIDFADAPEGVATAPPQSLALKGRALLSWRVTLLPYLNENDLFKEFILSEPWDSVHNKRLLAKMPNIYAPVSETGKNDTTSTFYQVFVGPGAGFERHQALGLRAFTGGDAHRIKRPDIGTHTIMIAEAGRSVPWTKPEDLPYDPDEPLPELGGLFKDGFNVAMFDGSVQWIQKDADESAIRAAIERNGGELADRLFGRPALSHVSSQSGDHANALKENQRLKQEYAELRDSLEQLKAEVKRAADTDVTDRRLREANRQLSEEIQKLKKEAQALTDQLRQLKQDSGGGTERKKY
jgi:RNA polymerase sigma factor (sigma-70 family)